MAAHVFEAVVVHEINHPVPNEDWIERRRVDEFSMRFEARGDGTASRFVADFVAEHAKHSRTWRLFRVVNGVRCAKDVREVAAERARQFGGRL